MNGRRQWVVLYRDFLFRIVDREALSSHAKGDASQLLLQILTLLLGVGVIVSLPAVFVDPGPHLRTLFAWSAQHFLIATTMLMVGIFAVLGWGSMFPDQRDLQVLAPLPVPAHTILLAKLAASGTALAASVLALHVVASVAWTLRLNASAPPVPRPAYTFDGAMSPLGAADLKAVLDRDFALAIREGPLAPGRGAGVAIGVSTHGTRRVFAYGAAAPDSIFHIASITKPFTGLALAQMIQQEAVRADEPVRNLIPEAGLGRPAGRRSDITLVDLVTHRSGLPGMPATFRSREPGNPFAGFDLETLYAFLRARGTGRPADPSFRYSNVGFGLLGHALATRAGVDYDGLIRQRITGPLAMSDTAVALTPEQQRRLLPGYDRDYLAVQVTEVPGILAAAGAMKSTAGDLLTWLEANLHPERLPPGPLATAIRASHQRQAGAFGDTGIAFAWAVTPAGDLWHSGALVGASSLVSFNPAQERAVVVLANTNAGTTVSADLIAEHISARLDGRPPVAITDVTIPAQGGVRRWLRLFVAYWVTMLTASLFVFGFAIALHGLAAALLPHRYFLRVSSALQFGVFCVVVGTYFLQPMAATGSTMLEAQGGTFAASPSYWFLGLFQALNGSAALAPLARRAAAALGVGAVITASVYALSYLRTLRRLAEEPDITPAVRASWPLPRVGGLLQTAVVHFSARTLLRSAHHRIIFTFYLGIGFALSTVLLKAPRARELTEDLNIATLADTNEPLIVSSIVMLVCAIVGARLTFAMPRDLSANWIFRSLPVRGGAALAAGRRRALVLMAAAPVWVLSAAVFLSQWPWLPALAHLLVLALLGAILVELCLSGTLGIPFTCSYLPGQSRSHVSAPAAVIVLLLMTLVLADAERRALEDAGRFAAIISVLALGWIGARWRTSWLADGVAPEFEDEPADRLVHLEVWDISPSRTLDARHLSRHPIAAADTVTITAGRVAMAQPAWHVSGQYYETCSCDFVCPCLPGGMAVRPSKGSCTFAMAFAVDRGAYGSIALDGVGFIVLGFTPEEMGKGNWSVGLIVDEKASTEQRDAIGAIASGAAGGPMAALSGLVGKFLGIQSAPVRFDRSGLKWSVTASDFVDMSAEGVKGLNPDSAEPMHFDHTGHPAADRFALARASASRVDALGLTWQDAGGKHNGQYAPFSWRNS